MNEWWFFILAMIGLANILFTLHLRYEIHRKWWHEKNAPHDR